MLYQINDSLILSTKHNCIHQIKAGVFTNCSENYIDLAVIVDLGKITTNSEMETKLYPYGKIANKDWENVHNPNKYLPP